MIAEKAADMILGRQLPPSAVKFYKAEPEHA